MVERIRLQPLRVMEKKGYATNQPEERFIRKKAFINALLSRVDVTASEAEEEVILSRSLASEIWEEVSKTYHRENRGKHANLLGSRSDVVVPIVVGGEKVEHELIVSLDLNL